MFLYYPKIVTGNLSLEELCFNNFKPIKARIFKEHWGGRLVMVFVGQSLTSLVLVCIFRCLCLQDLKRKTYHFWLAQPVSAPTIAFAVGPFEVYPDPHMPSVATHFCLPGLVPLLKHTVATLHEVFDFYEDILSARYPFSSFKTVWIDQSYAEFQSYSSLVLFSVSLLFSKRIIEQTMDTRKVMALALAYQFFGCFIGMQTWSDAWLPRGIAGYIASLYMKRAFGNNEYRLFISDETDAVCVYENTRQGIILDPSSHTDSNAHFCLRFPQTISPAYMSAFHKKTHLVVRMLEQRIGQEVLLTVLNKLMVLAVAVTQGSQLSI